MTENKIVDKEKDKNNEVDLDKDLEKDKNQHSHSTTQKEQQSKTEQHDSRFRRLSQFLDLLNIPRHHSGHSGSSSSSNNSQQHSPQTPHAAAASETTPTERRSSNSSCNNNATGHDAGMTEQEHNQQQQQQYLHQDSPKRSSCVSFRSEILLFDLVNGELNDISDRSETHKDDYGTQRVYKKTSPNSVLTMYLPTREIILSGSKSSALEGIVFADPKAIQGYRIYAQLALTFRYGREDEEVMGLRFCNEAIMSLQQIWPTKTEIDKPSLSPLQEALLKRLGDGAHPFTLTLTAQAPPSVQLVPAKRYYGAPIGTSYDVRCFVGDKSDEKFHRRASVKMGIRVIYRTDVFKQGHNGPENFAAFTNNPISSPSDALPSTNTDTSATSAAAESQTAESSALTAQSPDCQQPANAAESTAAISSSEIRQSNNKPRKSERGDSFPKLRLSPKTFRFSGRFGRSKSEVDKCPSETLYNYSKSFQEYESACPISCSGPQGAVDKPFLLQDGRVGLRASLDKAWYTHGEDVCVTVNIRNDSKKTVRKIRVCAIQHVDVCMFNNGKFKNVVADSENITPPPVDDHVAPGATLNTTFTLKPQRGATKNWIALEDTLQRSNEPDEINANIAASAVRTPHFLMQANHSPSNCTSPAAPAAAKPAAQTAGPAVINPNHDERNVFAIYVSYYVKVKLTLSGIGGELSLKLPFMLVHIDEEQRQLYEMHKLNLHEVPVNNKSFHKIKHILNEFTLTNNLDRIESVDEGNLSRQVSPLHVKDTNKAQTVLRENNEAVQLYASPGNERRRGFKRSETLAKDLETEDEENVENNIEQQVKVIAEVHSTSSQRNSSSIQVENIEFSNHRRPVRKNSKNLSEDNIQQFCETLNNKELNLATKNAINPAANSV